MHVGFDVIQITRHSKLNELSQYTDGSLLVVYTVSFVIFQRFPVFKMKTKKKIEMLEFTPRSQYACTKCIIYQRITVVGDLHLGDHLCFQHQDNFYHAILTNVSPFKKTTVNMRVVCAAKDISMINKICGRKLDPEKCNKTNEIVQVVLPEVDVTVIGLYRFQYGRKTYKNEKIVQRALAHVTFTCGQRVLLGSLTAQKIRPEAQFSHDATESTSVHFATWCSTGERFSFDSKKCQKKIEYQNKSQEITMCLKFHSEDDPVKQLTESHRQRLLCDSCFLSELVTMVNESKNPEQVYRLISPNNTAWINVRKIPRGLYRVKYKTIDNQVVVKLKRYNSKYKRLALIVKVETFTFTFNTGQKCEEDVEVKYKFPYPFWIIPSRNDDRF